MADTNVTAPSSEPTPAPATSGQPAATATAIPQAAAPQSATPTAPQAPATSGAPEGWVPSYRIRESREAAIREANAEFARREAEYKSQLSQVQSQLHALVGVQPPQDPEVSAVRNQFAKLYPNLAKLEERAEDVFGVLERAGDLESQTEHYWREYGRQSMNRLFEHANQSLGSPLTDEGKRALHASFTGFVTSSPELAERYANDPTLVEDFWKLFSSSFVDPVRRTAATGIQGRATTIAATPQDTPSGAPRIPGAPKPADLDERVSQAWAAYNATAKP